MGKKETEYIECLSVIGETLEKVGLDVLSSAITAYCSNELDVEELKESFKDFNKDFILSDFLKARGQYVRNETVQLGAKNYSLSGIISIGSDQYYDTLNHKILYRIILNPTSSTIIKLLYANVTIGIYANKIDRDRDLKKIQDKLNLLGIRNIKAK